MVHVAGDVGQFRGILVAPDKLTSFLHQHCDHCGVQRLHDLALQQSAPRCSHQTREQSVSRHRVAHVSGPRVGWRAVQKCFQCQLIATLCVLIALHMQDRGRLCNCVWSMVRLRVHKLELISQSILCHPWCEITIDSGTGVVRHQKLRILIVSRITTHGSHAQTQSR